MSTVEQVHVITCQIKTITLVVAWEARDVVSS